MILLKSQDVKMEPQDETDQMEVEEAKAKGDENDNAMKKGDVSKKRKLAEEDSIEEIAEEDYMEDIFEDEEIEDEEIEDENSEPFRGVVKDKKYFERNATFEAEREEILSGVPDHVKERFGQIFYSQWANHTLPVLLLSPYSVPPGPVRHSWFDMFEKVS
jgi:hypothetical protein